MLLLIIEVKYTEMCIVQGENSPGFVTIMNKFHTATYQHANNVHTSLCDDAFMTIASILT
jgi:hypothetical protein